ncbi:hypothetical protein MKJ01_01035 [Chryseobacterium sp. SSA4.19]|nr:hypothetical protein [Chryseobacterium sp. SSA4.19]MCJ8152341.1 hypothetical protein [Chryseobacterium sp. SSA4.19]
MVEGTSLLKKTTTVNGKQLLKKAICRGEDNKKALRTSQDFRLPRII